MGKPCRLSFIAFRDKDESLTYGEGPLDHFTEANLIDGIDYCRELMAQGYRYEPLDNFHLDGFINWATNTIRTGRIKHMAKKCIYIAVVSIVVEGLKDEEIDPVAAMACINNTITSTMTGVSDGHKFTVLGDVQIGDLSDELRRRVIDGKSN